MHFWKSLLSLVKYVAIKGSLLVKIRRSNSGAVLIVVLGILALLTVMAVSFVFSTRLSLRASEAYMRTVTATDIAEAGAANAIYVLEADKIKRTGDLRDPTVPVTETYDSLRDDWRRMFSAPVVISYDDTITDGNELGLAAGDTVTNVEPADADPPREGVTAKVIAIDTNNNLLYLNSLSTALWEVGDRLVGKRDQASNLFNVAVVTVSKPDEVDLDGDYDSSDPSTLDAIWHNYYDQSGNLIGRYAVLILDEQSKININVAGNLANLVGTWKDYSNGWGHGANEGWSPFEISLTDGLNATSTEARNITMYRRGFPPTASPGPGWTFTPGDGTDKNRIYVPGQNDMWSDTTTYDPASFNDDDDNYNRLFYANDGVDNDGDGTVDEATEGINEPEEFRPLRPYRGTPLDYNGSDDNSNGITDETNEADDQPILTLEQLEDSAAVGLSGFLTGTISTNFDGSTNTARDRRHFMSTLSHDRNLNRDEELRINPNFSIPEQNLAAVHAAFPSINAFDTDAFERPDLRNMQAAANIYDYRDRSNSRAELRDTAGDVFAGVEAIRINEVLVRAATNLYEGEWLYTGIANDWETAIFYGLNPVAQGAGSPRGTEDYLTNPDAWPNNSASETSAVVTVTLPDPPFDSATGYAFKLRMRVRSSGTQTLSNTADTGFRVYVNGNPVIYSGLGSDPGDPGTGYLNGQNCRWATKPSPQSTPNNVWYVEEAILSDNATFGDARLHGGDNSVYFEKPRPTSGSASDYVDDVDVDWFYFTLEPDCEWIELVNIGDQTVNVNNWTIVSEYTKDVDETALAKYVSESFQLSLPDVGILPVDDPTVWAPGPPHYIVFVIDRTDNAGASATISNGISFDTVWSTLATSANVYQLASISNIYSGGIDFFGNEPLDNPNNNTSAVDVRGTADGTDDVVFNVEAGKVSLYDANGNLVDQVTYDAGNVAEAFASLQRDHPANPGERLNADQNFKMRSYIATLSYPWNYPGYYNVVADGAYDDWKFWNDPWLTDPNVDPTLSTTEFVNYSPNSRGSAGFMTPAEANNRSVSYDRRVATAECKVKDRNLAGPGELVRAPLFHEYIAVVGYDETVAGTTDDLKLSVGDVIINEDENNQTAVILAINTTDYGSTVNQLGPSGWMVLRGDFQNPVSTWKFGDWMTDDGSDPTVDFGATISSVKMMDTYLGDEMDFYVEIGYANETADPSASDTITNTSKDPNQSGIATVVDTTDPDNKVIQLTMNQASGDPVTEWKVGETISYAAGAATITSVREKSADVRGLADYFTTACIDLEAAAANVAIQYSALADDSELSVGSAITNSTRTESDSLVGVDTTNNWIFFKPSSVAKYWAVGESMTNGSLFSSLITAAAASWPDTDDPEVYTVPPGASTNFTLTWDEDAGVQEGTYDLYSVVNYGSTQATEIPIYVGPVTIAKTSPGQQAMLNLTIRNAAAAAVQYHFIRAVLAPPPQTFGRINVNTASHQVLQGLRLELPNLDDSSAAWSETPTKSDYADAIIQARNIRAFESIGDVYRASEIQMQDASANPGYFFTPDVFRNISGLITARSDVYKIIVLGQAATDANNNGIIEEEEVTSSKKMEVIYQR